MSRRRQNTLPNRRGGAGGKGGGQVQAQPRSGGGGGGKGGGQPNVYKMAANSFQDAVRANRQGANFDPQMIGDPADVRVGNINASTYNAPQAQARGFNAARVGAPDDVWADQVQAGQIAGTDLSAYMNPYQQAVIDQTLGTLDRQRQMLQGQNGAAATAAKAFGGSRHGLVEAETNRAFAEQAANTTANLNAANFGQAQQAAAQDIGTRMQAGLANQGANLQSGMFNAGNQLQVGMANQAAQNAARQFGASAFNNNSQFNAGLGAQAGQFNAAAQNAAKAANQNMAFNTGTFNAGQALQAQLANQQAGLAGGNMNLAAANNLGNLSNLGFGFGQQITGNQWQQGAAQQQTLQALFDAAKGQYGGFSGAPQQSLSAMMAALTGANMGQQTQTTKQQPGLLNIMSALLGAF